MVTINSERKYMKFEAYCYSPDGFVRPALFWTLNIVIFIQCVYHPKL